MVGSKRFDAAAERQCLCWIPAGCCGQGHCTLPDLEGGPASCHGVLRVTTYSPKVLDFLKGFGHCLRFRKLSSPGLE